MFIIPECKKYFKFFCLLVMLSFAGCDKEDYYSHMPPDGMGSLVVDNNSGDEMSVYIDGVKVARVDGGDYCIVDHVPGFVRVVLSANHYDRSYRGDLDILQDKLTILDVMTSSAGNYYDYDVVTTFE